MLIPAINADYENILCISNEIPINYYLGDTVDDPNMNIEIASQINVIQQYNYDVIMVHLNVPDDASLTYKLNKPFFPLLEKLGRVGLTIHNKSCKGYNANEILFQQITWMHMELPAAIWYVENEHNDLLGCMELIENLRKVGIESYLLLDTCHLQMDLAPHIRYLSFPDEVLKNTLYMYSKYIGALHLSCSRLSEGYNIKTHGKPIKTPDDEKYFRSLLDMIRVIPFKNDVIVIPEVLEDNYTMAGDRANGKKAYAIIKEYM